MVQAQVLNAYKCPLPLIKLRPLWRDASASGLQMRARRNHYSNLIGNYWLFFAVYWQKIVNFAHNFKI